MENFLSPREGAFIGAILSPLALFVAWRFGFFLPIPQQKKSCITWAEVGFAFLLFYFSQIFFSVLGMHLGTRWMAPSFGVSPFYLGWLLCVVEAITVSLLVIFLFTLNKEKQTWILCRKKGKKVGRSILFGSMCWLVAYPATLFVNQLLAGDWKPIIRINVSISKWYKISRKSEISPSY